jgi:hypothetical protein
MIGKFNTMLKRKNKRIIQKLGRSLLVLASRWVKLAPNFSLVGGFIYNQDSWWASLVPLVIFDLLKGGFYQGFIFTYLGFASYYLLGRLVQNNWKKKIMILPIASLLFFLISNFGVWLYWYEPTWSGLIKTYTLALPFYRNTLLSDVIFGTSFILLKQFIVKKDGNRASGLDLKLPGFSFLN